MAEVSASSTSPPLPGNEVPAPNAAATTPPTPAETSITGRKRTRSGSLPPSFTTPHVTSAIGLEVPRDHLSQEVEGGVAAIVPATPQQLEPETGLTPSHVPASVVVVTEDPVVVVSRSLRTAVSNERRTDSALRAAPSMERRAHAD